MSDDLELSVEVETKGIKGGLEVRQEIGRVVGESLIAQGVERAKVTVLIEAE